MTDSQELRPLIEEVIQARKTATASREAIAFLRQKWEDDHQDIIQCDRGFQEALVLAETQLRDAALVVFASTGEKQVAPGVSIRVNRKVAYRTEDATMWSHEHGGIAHVFDPKIFEKLALAGQAADIARIVDAPIATLAKTLE